MRKLWILTFIILSFILTAFGQYGFIPNFEGELYRRDLTNPANAALVGITIGQIGASDFDLNGQLYAISNNDNGLYLIDTTTAAATMIAIFVPASGHMWTGMACDPTDGNIYFLVLMEMRDYFTHLLNPQELP